MSKIYNLYENDLDRTWYDSSNVLYSECDDVTDGLKVLRVTFKNEIGRASCRERV